MAAYDSTYLYDGYARPVIAFDAQLPAFAAIGRRFEAVSEAADEFARTADDCEGMSWRETVSAQPADESEAAIYRIECGQREAVTDDQKRLFEWLASNQERVVAEIKPAVLNLFQESLDRPRAWDEAEDRVLFPPDATDEEKLDRFAIQHFQLDPRGRFLLIELASLDEWYEEHGCSVMLRDGRVAAYGSWDDVNGNVDAE